MGIFLKIGAFFEMHSGAILFSLSIVVLLSFLLLLVVALKVAALSRPLAKLKSDRGAKRTIPAILQDLEKSKDDIGRTASSLSDLRRDSRFFFQHSALVKYDAFEDVGGKQSYSLCLLDDRKSGYIITYLTGRNSTRSYAVEVKDGEASRKLSDEEIRAFKEALSSG